MADELWTMWRYGLFTGLIIGFTPMFWFLVYLAVRGRRDR